MKYCTYQVCGTIMWNKETPPTKSSQLSISGTITIVELMQCENLSFRYDMKFDVQYAYHNFVDTITKGT